MIPDNPEVVAAAVTVLLSAAEALRERRKHGRVSLDVLAWDAKLTLLRVARANLFTVPKPDREGVVIDDSPENVEHRLAKQGFVPDWPLSYRYEGELFNLRFYFYEPTKSLPNRQIHVRGFEHPRGVELLCHEEPTPEHHPNEHLDESDMEHGPAVEWVKQKLENEVPVGYPAE